jgi:hypothetical protein
MQPVIDSINRIIYKIHKKKNPLLAEIINDTPRSRATRYLEEFLILEIKPRLFTAKQASGN